MSERRAYFWAKLTLLGLVLVLSFLSYRASKLEFDYNFENFFPKANDDLEFYQSFRETFENDNDFIIIGVGNRSGIFDSTFLTETQRLVEDLKNLPHLREVISPLEQTYLERSKSGLGFASKPYFHVKDPSSYGEDLKKVSSTSEPISAMVNADATNLIIVIKNVQMISKQKSDELATALHQVLSKYHFDELHALGKVLGQKAYIDIMRNEFLKFMLISIAVLIVFLWLTYRALWGLMIPLLTVLLAVVGSLGIMELSGTPLNMMTTLLPVIMLVVGMSDVIHLISKYLEEIRMGRHKIEALKHMLKKVGVATLLTSLTTALGFITLIGVQMDPVKDFGIYTAIGVLLAFVLSILFIPSIFVLLKKPDLVKKVKTNSQWDRFLSNAFLLILKKRQAVFSIYVALTLLSLLGASRIKFDYYLMQDLGEEHALMQELRYFQNNFGGLRPFEMALIPQSGKSILDYEVMMEVEKLERFLVKNYELNQLSSPTQPIKLLNKALRNGREEYYKLPENKKRYDYLIKQLSVFKEKEEFKMIVSVEEDLGRISGRIKDPGSRSMLFRNEALAEFERSNINANLLQIRLTGTPVIIDESGRYVSKNVIIGLFIAFFIIALSMGILFKSVKMAFLSLVPNLFPILLTAGFIGFAGIDLNMTTAVVFTVAFGIAVDDTIHFLSRYRQEIRSGKVNLLSIRRTYISTGKAVIITSIILLGGFGSLIFSDFLSTFYIGLFVSMTLVFAVLTDLTLLPLLLLKSKK